MKLCNSWKYSLNLVVTTILDGQWADKGSLDMLGLLQTKLYISLNNQHKQTSALMLQVKCNIGARRPSQ